jgi:hypothetical protein
MALRTGVGLRKERVPDMYLLLFGLDPETCSMISRSGVVEDVALIARTVEYAKPSGIVGAK